MHMTGFDLASGEDRQSLAIMKGNKVHMIVDRDTLTASNAGRKAEREYIARALLAIVERLGPEVERSDRTPTRGYCGAGIDLRFKLNGVGATVSISNLHGGFYSLISWYNTEYPGRNFTPRFSRLVGDTPKPRPHHKATSCPDGWYSLAMSLDAGLCLAFQNQAFVNAFDL